MASTITINEKENFTTAENRSDSLTEMELDIRGKAVLSADIKWRRTSERRLHGAGTAAVSLSHARRPDYLKALALFLLKCTKNGFGMNA